MFKKTIVLLCLVLVLNTLSFTSSIFAEEAYENVEGYEFNEIDIEISDKNLELALEIAKSTLEEETTLVNGEYVIPYENFKDAKVSEKAFNYFQSVVATINQDDENFIKTYKLSELAANTENVNKGTDLDDKVITPFVTHRSTWYGAVYGISNSESQKITKVLVAGGGAAALAAALGTPHGTAVAAAIGLLGGVNGLCNWNNRGYNIHTSRYNVPVPGMPVYKPAWCVPK